LKLLIFQHQLTGLGGLGHGFGARGNTVALISCRAWWISFTYTNFQRGKEQRIPCLLCPSRPLQHTLQHAPVTKRKSMSSTKLGHVELYQCHQYRHQPEDSSFGVALSVYLY